MNVQVISFNCILKNKDGQLISSTRKHDVLNRSLENDSELKGLVRDLQNLTKGEKRSVSLTAEEAYGSHQQQKVIFYPRQKLRKTAAVGDVVSVTGVSGAVRTYKLVQFHGDMASLDGNHPLAGQDLIFEIETLDVRDATALEISDHKNSMSIQILH
jgi:FKBP-type peptidyl-prolyl cis-trans isomerase SlyD